jgi:hypothetical protein
MTKKIYYEKVGRKYVPVREYDSDLMDSFPAGTHMVVCHPGGRSYRYNIDPAFAPMIAAGRYCEDVISSAIMKAHECRPYGNQVLTPEQRAAWDNLLAVMPDKGRYLEWPSAREVADAAVEALSDEALKMLDNPSVRKAYDHFMLMAALAEDYHSA